MRTLSFSELSFTDGELLIRTKEGLIRAYNPYSQNLASASVIDDKGRVYTAGNFFNSATGVNICAERAAILCANADGTRSIETLYLVSDFKKTDKIIAPCGTCRQFLLGVTEITKKDIRIILATKELNEIIVTTLFELLPLPYFSE